MSTAKDVTKIKPQPDGSYNRAPSSFRNVIKKGGKFAPERGMYILSLLISICVSTYKCVIDHHLYVSFACRELH